MSRPTNVPLGVAAYVALTNFVVGHVWRYRRDGYTWTARSTQLLERRLLLVGSLAFHFGMLGVIGGHVIESSWPIRGRGRSASPTTSTTGWRWSGRRGRAPALPRSAGTGLPTSEDRPSPSDDAPRSDWVMYPLLLVTIVLGMLCTFVGGLIDEYHYRETVSPWFRSVFTFDPEGVADGRPHRSSTRGT